MKELKRRLTWMSLFFLAAAILMAVLLLEFRFQEVPEYKIGDIAAQDVRAPREIIYEDKQETAKRKEAARERTPALYELEVQRIAVLKRQLALAFDAARRDLAALRIAPTARLSRAKRKQVLESLAREVGQAIPPRFLPLFFKLRFDAALEQRIWAALNTVLGSGIVADPDLFRQHMKRGILVRERGGVKEKGLADSSQVRSLRTAKEYLRQFQLEFAALPALDRAELFSFMEGLLFPTLVYNAAETQIRREAAAGRVPAAEVQIKKGKIMIRAGEEVTPRAEADLAALRHWRKPRPILGRLLGLFFFVATFLYALWRYLAYDQKRYRNPRTQTAIVMLLLILFVGVMRLLTALADVLGEHVPPAIMPDPSGLYFAIPFAFSSMLGTLLIDLNVGFIISMITGVLAGLFYGDVYLVVYSLLGSLAGVYGIKKYKERAGLLKTGLMVGWMNALGAVAIHLLRQDVFIWSKLLGTAAMGGLSGMAAAALCLITWPMLESIFKIPTDMRLLELSNLNASLLRRLSTEAPGTYHHSLMVGNLAEAAAEAIGANPLLVRVGAYYHDLGKLRQPGYFAENQAAGASKHGALTPRMSCRVIARHVENGLELAKAAGLMKTICDLIAQHHGTRVMDYFYQKSRKSAPGDGPGLRREDFRYPGPKPQSKEAAILMLADGVEAASRTLSNASLPQIKRMIDLVVDGVLADNQLNECDITLREIQMAKESFLKVLGGMGHRRIEYPGHDFTLPQMNGRNGRASAPG